MLKKLFNKSSIGTEYRKEHPEKDLLPIEEEVHVGDIHNRENDLDNSVERSWNANGHHA